MEAMDSVLLSIASKVGGNPELVSHGETGLLFTAGDAGDLADQLRAAIVDDSLRQRLASSGAKRIAEEFGGGHSLRVLEDIYSRKLERR
jgi:glycosyltransferase involved in cell wall biosynthesis